MIKCHAGLTKIVLAGLGLRISCLLHIKKLPGVGLAPTQIFLRFDGILFDESKTYRKHAGDPRRRFRLVLWLEMTLG